MPVLKRSRRKIRSSSLQRQSVPSLAVIALHSLPTLPQSLRCRGNRKGVDRQTFFCRLFLLALPKSSALPRKTDKREQRDAVQFRYRS